MKSAKRNGRSRNLRILCIATIGVLAFVACAKVDEQPGLVIGSDVDELAMEAVLLEAELAKAQIEAERLRADADALIDIAVRERAEADAAAAALAGAEEEGLGTERIEELTALLEAEQAEAAVAEAAAAAGTSEADKTEAVVVELQGDLGRTNVKIPPTGGSTTGKPTCNTTTSKTTSIIASVDQCESLQIDGVPGYALDETGGCGFGPEGGPGNPDHPGFARLAIGDGRGIAYGVFCPGGNPRGNEIDALIAGLGRSVTIELLDPNDPNGPFVFATDLDRIDEVIVAFTTVEIDVRPTGSVPEASRVFTTEVLVERLPAIIVPRLQGHDVSDSEVNEALLGVGAELKLQMGADAVSNLGAAHFLDVDDGILHGVALGTIQALDMAVLEALDVGPDSAIAGVLSMEQRHGLGLQDPMPDPATTGQPRVTTGSSTSSSSVSSSSTSATSSTTSTTAPSNTTTSTSVTSTSATTTTTSTTRPSIFPTVSPTIRWPLTTPTTRWPLPTPTTLWPTITLTLVPPTGITIITFPPPADG